MEMFSNFNRDRVMPKSDTSDRITDGNENYGINDWKKRNSFLLKSVSVILAVVFLNQQMGWADNGRAVWAQTKPVNQVGQAAQHLKDNFEMPYDLASTEDIEINGGDETIIQIQDAHASLSAQYSIVKLLDNLVDNYNLSFVALEGAGSGYIDTAILKSCPDKEIRKDTADHLMGEGYMSAGEFFTVTCDKTDISLYGIEAVSYTHLTLPTTPYV